MDERNERKRKSQFKDVVRRFRKNKLAVVAFFVLIVIILCTIFSEYITPYDYAKQDLRNKMAYPSLEHPLGTDQLGRDLLTRILVGGRVSLSVAFLAVILAVIAGGLLGASAGYFGGLYDNIIMRSLDVISGIPRFLLAICVQAALGTGIRNAAVAIAIGTIPSLARITRSSVLTIGSNEFVEAARANGASSFRIIVDHLIPNALAPIIVTATLDLGSAILTISSLSFIGLGVQPPTPEWGSILASGRLYIRDFYPIVTFPGIAILITLLAFNLAGDGLRDALDPKLKR